VACGFFAVNFSTSALRGMANRFHQEIAVVNTFVHFRDSDGDEAHLRRSKTAPVDTKILEAKESSADVSEEEEQEQEATSPSASCSGASEQSDASPVVSVLNTFLHVSNEKRPSSYSRSRTAPESILRDEESETSEAEDGDSTDAIQPQLARDVTADLFESPMPGRHQMVTLQSQQMPMTAPSVPVVFMAPVTALPCRPESTYFNTQAKMPQMAQPCLLGRTNPVNEAGLDTHLTPGIVSCETAGGKELIRWTVDARKLDSHDTKVLSPAFQLEVPGQGPQPFRLMVLATQTSGKGGASFQKAGGRGRIILKCESSSESDDHRMALAVRLSSSTSASHRCIHNFSEQSCCSMQEQDADWNFKAAVVKSRRCFQIYLEAFDQSTATEPC